jgi:hypothetical protein
MASYFCRLQRLIFKIKGKDQADLESQPQFWNLLGNIKKLELSLNLLKKLYKFMV